MQGEQNSNFNQSTLDSIKVLHQMQNIIKQRVDHADYQQQIERWNSYQHMLDEIDIKCGKTDGDVQLRRNIRHNAKILDETAVAFLSVIGLFALVVCEAGIASNNLYAILGAAITLALVGWQAFIRLHQPSFVHFTSKPVLHVDEYAYMNKAIKGIRKVQHDPVVSLPPLEMSIPRNWLAQQGLLDFMQTLADVKNLKEER